MTVWKQERPAWCPHQDCAYRASSQGAICVGELPAPTPHEGDFNTHRLCMTHSCENDAPWMMELEINGSDAWGIARVLSRVFGFKQGPTPRQEINNMSKDLGGVTEAVASAICKSGKFETGEGCCAVICMGSLGCARNTCPYTVRVHGVLADAAIAAYQAAASAAVADGERLRKAVEPLVSAAQGLSHGTDWNNGTHAKLHGYRRKLLRALPAALAALHPEAAASDQVAQTCCGGGPQWGHAWSCPKCPD